MVSMSLMRGQLKVGGGCPGTTSSTSITAPMLAQPTDSPSPSEVQEIPLGEATKKAPEASGKHPAEAPSGQRKKAKVHGRHKSYREGEKSRSRAAKGKEPTALVEGTPSPRARPKSVKELCNARLREDGRDYHVIQMEDEFLKLTRVMEALRVDLPKQAIEDYKKSPGFEIGLVQMGRVSLEYGYQLALAQFRARYPDLEVEEDPFKLLSEDSNVTMVDEQPLDDSPLPPKE
ncbi:hypothetical protein B296_00043745 [Ensete ventricosum]|uniref:Uncharacterized protein n=1 Tax=Ensete ventricosum TaxID=4639 RepID=A0A426X7I4_ENSVE|nr:hypothetical protein B296_00043745 [Ensete ventricosum]